MASYTTGTITLTNGSAVVTGTGTAWQTALISGGVIFPAAPGGNAMPVLTVESNTQITAAVPWSGATGAYSYALQINNDVNQVLRNAQALSEYIQRLDNNSLAALASIGSSLAAGKVPRGLSTTTMEWFTVSDFFKTLADDQNAAAVYGTLGQVPNAQIRGDLPPDKAFRQGNVLGTVSQSGGTPTGSIIERGSNANGEYVRFADGTQECICNPSVNYAAAPTTAQTFTCPAAFSAGSIRVGKAMMGTFSGTASVQTQISIAASSALIEVGTTTYGIYITEGVTVITGSFSMKVSLKGRWF